MPANHRPSDPESAMFKMYDVQTPVVSRFRLMPETTVLTIIFPSICRVNDNKFYCPIRKLFKNQEHCCLPCLNIFSRSRVIKL